MILWGYRDADHTSAAFRKDAEHEHDGEVLFCRLCGALLNEKEKNLEETAANALRQIEEKDYARELIEAAES